MTAAPPPSIQRAIEDGVLCYLGVRSAFGPHVTPVVFVIDGGRLWLTTSRRSVKARAWRRDPNVAGLIRASDRAVVFRGTVRTYDALDPLSWPAATVAGPRLVRAATRFSLKNARFFAGYAVDAGRVPLAWSPPGRVFARVELDAGLLLDGQGEVLDSWGRWPGSSEETMPGAEDLRAGGRASGRGHAVRLHLRRTFSPLPGVRGLDLRVPAPVRGAVGGSGKGALGLLDGNHTVFPVRWRRVPAEGAYEAVLPVSLVGSAGPPDEGEVAALTVDRVSTWRASSMAGILLQGRAEVFAPSIVRRGVIELRKRIRASGYEGDEDRAALIRLMPTRAVWWQGWTSGTVAKR